MDLMGQRHGLDAAVRAGAPQRQRQRHQRRLAVGVGGNREIARHDIISQQHASAGGRRRWHGAEGRRDRARQGASGAGVAQAPEDHRLAHHLETLVGRAVRQLRRALLCRRCIGIEGADHGVAAAEVRGRQAGVEKRRRAETGDARQVAASVGVGNLETAAQVVDGDVVLASGPDCRGRQVAHHGERLRARIGKAERRPRGRIVVHRQVAPAARRGDEFQVHGAIGRGRHPRTIGQRRAQFARHAAQRQVRGRIARAVAIEPHDIVGAAAVAGDNRDLQRVERSGAGRDGPGASAQRVLRIHVIERDGGAEWRQRRIARPRTGIVDAERNAVDIAVHVIDRKRGLRRADGGGVLRDIAVGTRGAGGTRGHLHGSAAATGLGGGRGGRGGARIAKREARLLHFFHQRFRYHQRLLAAQRVGAVAGAKVDHADDAGSGHAHDHHEQDQLDDGDAARPALSGDLAQPALNGNLARPALNGDLAQPALNGDAPGKAGLPAGVVAVVVRPAHAIEKEGAASRHLRALGCAGDGHGCRPANAGPVGHIGVIGAIDADRAGGRRAIVGAARRLGAVGCRSARRVAVEADGKTVGRGAHVHGTVLRNGELLRIADQAAALVRIVTRFKDLVVEEAVAGNSAEDADDDHHHDQFDHAVGAAEIVGAVFAAVDWVRGAASSNRGSCAADDGIVAGVDASGRHERSICSRIAERHGNNLALEVGIDRVEQESTVCRGRSRCQGTTHRIHRRRAGITAQIGKTWQRGSGQNAQNHNHHDQLDERETGLGALGAGHCLLVHSILQI
uniref:Uncharacterized protein n=1 Tax=Tanacetum cinerariifolium TaxID=118510 RepID=A0A699GED6_TANCI|nr:hypothetical protein [Tanacetum cinerariifolium]